MDSSTLKNKTIFIAGATSGMGRETAMLAAKKNASLILLGRDSDRLATIGSDTGRAGAKKVTCIEVDAADANALEKALEPHEAVMAELDILVNSVGTNISKRAFVDLSVESWSDMIDCNLNAAFNLAKIVIPVFRKRKSGLLINISSTAAKKPDPSGAAYQASKAGVAAMTHAIQEEEWQNGIRATVIMPGMTDTPLLNKRPSPPTEKMRASALQPEDIAAACVFVMELPARAHVPELTLQPSVR